MSRNYDANKADPFATGANAPTPPGDSVIYEGEDVPDLQPSGREVAKRYKLSEITPARVQPRKIIPDRIRHQWDGSPGNIPLMLRAWQADIMRRTGQEFDPGKLITDEDYPLPFSVEDYPFLESFLTTASTAASILQKGQINAITIYRHGDGYRVETGERRLIACNMLYEFVSPEHNTIKALVIDEHSVWRQADENNSREGLNAISMARQFAMLLIDMYENDPESNIRDYAQIISDGGSDRDYFAQVADAKNFRVKYGWGKKVTASMGLSTLTRTSISNALNNYRSILSVPDEIWQRADEENWTERRIRAEIDRLNNTNRSGHFTPPQGNNKQLSPTGDNSQRENGLFQDMESAAFPPPAPNPTPPPPRRDDATMKPRPAEWQPTPPHRKPQPDTSTRDNSAQVAPEPEPEIIDVNNYEPSNAAFFAYQFSPAVQLVVNEEKYNVVQWYLQILADPKRQLLEEALLREGIPADELQKDLYELMRVLEATWQHTTQQLHEQIEHTVKRYRAMEQEQ